MSIKKPRGTSDILPAEIPAWRFVEEVCRRQAAIYGFSEIRFPTFECTELFARGVGGTTDIVQKEMYTFTDKDERSMTLRPEGTACVCRSVVENGLYAGALPLKLFYLSNFFRYEKPQAGRTREFFQFGCECFGPSTPQADAEAILLGDSVIRGLGIKGCVLHLNSIGCADCRPAYRAALKEYFASHYDELCDTCRSRLDTNPLRILDCKSPVCSAIADGAPRTTDHLCENCRAHYEELKSILAQSGVEYIEDPRCVRGLDYYTGTVFEFVHGGIGAQSALGGGGRYNGLIAELGGPELPAIGFALGLSRLIMAMEAENAQLPADGEGSLYIAPLGGDAVTAATLLCQQLRTRGVRCETDITGRSAKAQLKYADKSGHTYVAVIGTDELAAGKCELKNLRTGEKTGTALDADSLAAAVK
ncbi:MAG: histidine--tRNA ligase [Clostridia bacterium]|nr:histidine--tRNA ligase [Clostridia bacterium]